MAPESEGRLGELTKLHEYLSSTRTLRTSVESPFKPTSKASSYFLHSQKNGEEHISVPANAESGTSLGHFADLFKALNLPADGEIPALPKNVRQQKATSSLEPFGLMIGAGPDEHLAYASDSALLRHHGVGQYHFRNEAEDLGNQTAAAAPSSQTVNGLSKKQRRKANRRAREGTDEATKQDDAQSDVEARAERIARSNSKPVAPVIMPNSVLKTPPAKRTAPAIYLEEPTISTQQPQTPKTVQEQVRASLEKARANKSTPEPAVASASKVIQSISTQDKGKDRATSSVLQPLQSSRPNERAWSLLLKIMTTFPECRSHMNSPIRHGLAPKNDPSAVHVFIDASNIFIGFLDRLKRKRGIPDGARVKGVYPSFASLALLLERRRPVAKRTIVGSTPPWAPAFDKAKECGYELNILEKVYKLREPTERQKYFAARDGRKKKTNGYASSNGGNSSEGSGSETAVNEGGEYKWVEQGVDEVLHNKMGESLVDTRDPAPNAMERPTAVLATGDYQEAEYSSGFGAWAMRMLEHGWNVEIAAWSANISQMYYAMQRVPNYRGRFRVIQLDDFVEDLFHDE